MIHTVKSWPMFFKYILAGTRTSDIRSTEDRNFQEGDVLLLQEWNPADGKYSGREHAVDVTFVQVNKSNPCAISEEAIAPGYAVLSIRLKELK